MKKMFTISIFALIIPGCHAFLDHIRLPTGSINLVSNKSQQPYRYYNVELEKKAQWLDRDDYSNQCHQILKNKRRSYEEIKLKKRFRFYGHLINTVIITSGGFIHTDEFRHSMLTHSMYIAPFMADLHTNDSYQPPAKIFLLNNATMMIIWWENIRYYKDKDVSFTFQLIYHSNGRIIFNYLMKLKEHEIEKLMADDTNHSLKVGISDASYLTRDFSNDMQIHFMLPYHSIDIPLQQLTNHSRIVFTPLPTCVEHDTCESCINSRVASKLDCSWCPTAKLCSDGVDRLTQKWIEKGCFGRGKLFTSYKACLLPHKPFVNHDPPSSSHAKLFEKIIENMANDKVNSSSKKTFIRHKTTMPANLLSAFLPYKAMFLKLFFFVVIFVAVISCAWAIRNLRNPDTLIGRWFIQNQFLNRWRGRRSVVAMGGPADGSVLATALSRFNSAPSYIAFNNNDDGLFERQQQPQSLSPINELPPLYRSTTVINERAYETPHLSPPPTTSAPPTSVKITSPTINAESRLV